MQQAPSRRRGYRASLVVLLSLAVLTGLGAPAGAAGDGRTAGRSDLGGLGALVVYDDAQRSGARLLDGASVEGDAHVELVVLDAGAGAGHVVDFSVDGMRVRTEVDAPWSLGGDEYGAVLGHPLEPGAHEVRTEIRRVTDGATEVLRGVLTVTAPASAEDAPVADGEGGADQQDGTGDGDDRDGDDRDGDDRDGDDRDGDDRDGAGAPARPGGPEAAAGFVSGGRVVVDTGFEELDLGSVSPDEFVEAFGDAHTRSASRFAPLSVRGGDDRYLRVDVPAGWPRTSVNLQVRFDDAERGCLSYRVRFSDDWDWSRGGKLPGPAGVAPGASLADAAGGGDKPQGDDAWSARIMWRNGYAGYTEGDLVTYLYHPEQRGEWGDDVRWRNVRARRGVWHEVVQCVAMNTPGERDGVLRAWFDGRPVVDRDDMRYRTDDDLALDRIFFAVFRGGSDASWAGDRDGHVDLDDVRMTVR